MGSFYNRKYNEKYLEKKLREEVKKLGGIALKFQSQSYTGMPDRLILMPSGKVFWAEMKTTGMKLRAEQKTRKAMLEKLGYRVFVIDNKEGLGKCLKEINDYSEAYAAVDQFLKGDNRALDGLINGAVQNEV